MNHQLFFFTLLMVSVYVGVNARVLYSQERELQSFLHTLKNVLQNEVHN